MSSILDKNSKSLATEDYTNFYCPNCTQELTNDGCCWTLCEYEVKPDYPPLTEAEMLIKRIKQNGIELSFTKKKVTLLTGCIANYNKRLTKIIDQ